MCVLHAQILSKTSSNLLRMVPIQMQLPPDPAAYQALPLCLFSEAGAHHFPPLKACSLHLLFSSSESGKRGEAGGEQELGAVACQPFMEVTTQRAILKACHARPPTLAPECCKCATKHVCTDSGVEPLQGLGWATEVQRYVWRKSNPALEAVAFKGCQEGRQAQQVPFMAGHRG